MNDKINDGGSAFPLNASDAWGGPVQGMTLHDYAAVHGPGLHDDASIDYAKAFNEDPLPSPADLFGRAAWWAKAEWVFRYMQADAMLAARKGGADAPLRNISDCPHCGKFREHGHDDRCEARKGGAA